MWRKHFFTDVQNRWHNHLDLATLSDDYIGIEWLCMYMITIIELFCYLEKRIELRLQSFCKLQR